MNKIYLTNDDVNWLIEWRDKHVDLVRSAPVPVKTIEISSEGGARIVASREDDILKFHISAGDTILGNVKYRVMQNGLCNMLSSTIKMNEQSKREVCQDVLTVYATLMALMVYGNNEANAHTGSSTVKKRTDRTDRPSKPAKKSKKQSRPNITYILKRSGGAPSVIVSGSHRSPSGQFSVRGHYRHYKNGRTVWIAEYNKGTGKKKGKNYRVKPDTPKS